jgi:hypothetical protein
MTAPSAFATQDGLRRKAIPATGLRDAGRLRIRYAGGLAQARIKNRQARASYLREPSCVAKRSFPAPCDMRRSSLPA